MLLSPGNKSGNSLNFYLQKSITWWEPNFKDFKMSGMVQKKQKFLIFIVIPEVNSEYFSGNPEILKSCLCAT